jgi:cytoskeletal protein RodZ
MFEIGATLREARERRQLTYEQVEAETKIRAKYLRALEEEEFDSLPSGTYVRGFLRAYASYLGLDGRLFVDEYASRFGTRHDDELFRRRRERPMTQRQESSTAVLVALIAVVAIGVLFFVAWRFGPGDASSPLTVTSIETKTAGVNKNTEIPATTASVETTDGSDRLGAATRVAVSLRVEVGNASTWVKITRISTHKVIAQQQVAAGGRLGGGALKDDYGFHIEAGVPGNVTLFVNTHSFRLTGKGPWNVTADSEAPHVVQGPLPKAPITEKQ